EAEQKSAIVHDRDRHRPIVLHRFGFARSQHFLDVGQGQTWFRAHRRLLNRYPGKRLDAECHAPLACTLRRAGRLGEGTMTLRSIELHLTAAILALAALALTGPS